MSEKIRTITERNYYNILNRKNSPVHLANHPHPGLERLRQCAKHYLLRLKVAMIPQSEARSRELKLELSTFCTFLSQRSMTSSCLLHPPQRCYLYIINEHEHYFFTQFEQPLLIRRKK